MIPGLFVCGWVSPLRSTSIRSQSQPKAFLHHRVFHKDVLTLLRELALINTKNHFDNMPRGYQDFNQSVDSFISLSEILDEVKEVPEIKPRKGRRGFRFLANGTRKSSQKDGSSSIDTADVSESESESQSVSSVRSFDPGMLRTKKSSTKSLQKLDSMCSDFDHSSGPKSVCGSGSREATSKKTYRRTELVKEEEVEGKQKKSSRDLKKGLARGQTSRVSARRIPRRPALQRTSSCRAAGEKAPKDNYSQSCSHIDPAFLTLTPNPARPSVSRFSSKGEAKPGASTKSIDQLISDFDRIMAEGSIRNMQRCAADPVAHSPLRKVADDAARRFEMLMDEEASKHAAPYRTGWV